MAKRKRKNIVGNFRGKEDIFWTKVVKGFREFFKSPFMLRFIWQRRKFSLCLMT